MFVWWGGAIARLRWWVVGATGVLVLVGGLWGTGLFGTLGSGGFDDPSSQSSVANARIQAEFGPQAADVVVLYSSDSSTVDQPGLRGPVTAALARLDSRPEVALVESYYLTGSPMLVSQDRHETYASIRLREDGLSGKGSDLAAIMPLLEAGSGVRAQIGGNISFQADANTQIERDIVRAETLSLPILLILLIVVFRGFVAAAMPILVGIVATMGAFVITRMIAGYTDISVFATNVITLLALGMSVDYALFIVSRFREELAAGRDTGEAMRRTITTAGRTVAVSGLTVALALSSLLLFPMGFLKSMAYGGMSAVLVAMLAALTTLPAVLTLLGPRVNSRRVRSAGAGSGWARLARSVMRRPVLYLVVVAGVLLAVATPFLRASFGGFDERVLPAGTPSRVVAERIAADFPGGSLSPIVALVDGGGAAAGQTFAQSAVGVAGVTNATVTATRGASSLVSIAYTGAPSSNRSREVVSAVRALPAPPGSQVLVTGRPAADLDQLASLGSRLPWMALYVGLVTFLLLFLAFGSIVLPVKAIVMNIISIGASFGVVVWVFQDGHLSSWLGFTPTGFLEPTNLILMLAVLFGLSTDYEVFLLSRVREEWDRTGDNTGAVTTGLQRTGRIITAAAALLIIVIGGFATGGAATIKMLGIGTLVAVAVDAALVRTLLVPATMRLLGRWNWWAPGPLRKVYRRYGLREGRADPVVRAPAGVR
jgi:RND superfamily putative drug exporter